MQRKPFNISEFTFFTRRVHELTKAMLHDPDQFMSIISKLPDYLSPTYAGYLDTIDPLNHTADLFNIDKIYPFAGHSLGPVFQPVVEKIMATATLQKQLHAGHFSSSHPEGNKNGHWFDCDRYEPAVQAAQQLLGFAHPDEFIFTATGLSENLAKLLDTFFRPGKQDWQSGKTKILMLANDFFSDQAVVTSVMKRAIKTAERFELFPANNAPDVASQIIKVNPDENGIYKTNDIIAAIKDNADKIQVICLSDVVFNTGQRLQLQEIFAAVKQDVEKNRIIVGLDLAHTVGNRAINLAGFPVRIDFAVGCGYKHLSGFAGSSFGIYVNKDVDLNKYPPLQGWKAADPTKVFATIHKYDDSIMTCTGAAAFRISNPPPVALMPAQAFLTYFGDIGFAKCFNKSECLTRYLIAQLETHLGDLIEFVTPLDAAHRGAMIVIRVKELRDVEVIEESLKNGKLAYEIDARPPNNIRLTAHYGYTKFEHIANLVQRLKLVIDAALAPHYSTGI